MGQLDAAAHAPDAQAGALAALERAAKWLACFSIRRLPHCGQAGSSLPRTRISLFAPQAAQA